MKIIKTCLRYLFVLVISILLGFLLIELSYQIPSKYICENILASKDDLADDPNNLNGSFLTKYNYTNPDDYTNSLILSSALIDGRGTGLSTALLNPHPDYKVLGAFSSVISTAEQIAQNQTFDTQNYGRYWHGYLCLIKPLLALFTYDQIILLNQIVLFSCICLFLLLVSKRFSMEILLPVIGMFFILNPFVISVSFQLSSILYILLFAMIALLVCPKVSFDKGSSYVFLVSGILVAYFDFLTYPMVALGVPLILALLLRFHSDIRDNVIYILKESILFFFGYLGMWSGKWILASIFTEENIIKDAIENILYRTGGNPVFTERSYKNTLSLTLHTIPSIIIVALLLMVAVYVVYSLYKKRDLLSNKSLRVAILIPSLYTFVWYKVVMNHTLMHPHLEFREWAIFVFGILTLIVLPKENHASK